MREWRRGTTSGVKLILRALGNVSVHVSPVLSPEPSAETRGSGRQFQRREGTRGLKGYSSIVQDGIPVGNVGYGL